MCVFKQLNSNKVYVYVYVPSTGILLSKAFVILFKLNTRRLFILLELTNLKWHKEEGPLIQCGNFFFQHIFFNNYVFSILYSSYLNIQVRNKMHSYNN